jgi:2-keto-myo-inositol isomerase
MTHPISRRHFTAHSLAAVTALSGVVANGSEADGSETDGTNAASQKPPTTSRVRFCLNTSTIRGQGLTLAEEIKLVGDAGYDGIEPWMREIQQHLDAGGTLKDLKRQLDDAGLTVDSAIGFANWIVDDDQHRTAGLESMKRDMELLREIGGTRIAAPPAGATDQADLSLAAAAERYARLLELGRTMGVTPQLEVWGFSKSLSRLGEVMYVAIESGDPDACLLPDVYHIYKGGSDFQGLGLIPGQAIHVMHLNDYPADPPRESIGDKDRVFPGDGVAPIQNIIRMLLRNGFAGTFSLELFNPQYWQRPATEVLAEGLQKMKQVTTAATT